MWYIRFAIWMTRHRRHDIWRVTGTSLLCTDCNAVFKL